MDNHQENLETLPRLARKTIKAMKFVQAGLTPREALEIVNDKETISQNAVDKFKAKVKKYSLTDPSCVRSAQSQIKRILKAKAREAVREKITDAEGKVSERIEYIHPTDSNILAAAAMVYDRYEPVRGQEQGAGQGNTYLDLSTIQVQIIAGPVDNSADNQVVDVQSGDKVIDSSK